MKTPERPIRNTTPRGRSGSGRACGSCERHFEAQSARKNRITAPEDPGEEPGDPGEEPEEELEDPGEEPEEELEDRSADQRPETSLP